MNYFHHIDEINKIEESDLNNITCVSKFVIKEVDYKVFLDCDVSVTNHAFVCRTEKTVKNFEYSGNLQSEPEFVANSFLESSDIETTWQNRIKYEVVENKYTLLSIRNNLEKDRNLKFVNGEEVLRFDYVLEGKLHVKFNEDYLTIVINYGNYKQRTDKNPVYLVLIKIVEKKNKNFEMVKLLKTNLCKYFPSCNIAYITFNMNMPSKLLLILGSRDSNSLATFNINTLQFSSSFKLNFHSSDYFYCYHNVLKEVIIFLDTYTFIVYVVKETTNGFYIYKKSLLNIGNMTEVYGSYCCCNRSNKILLFVTASKDGAYDMMEDNVEIMHELYLYDVLNDELITKLFGLFDTGSYRMFPVFFNRSGEEIFIADKNYLQVYVYKSKVRSLKKTCQMLVSLQYTSEQLKLMNLPKYILN